MKRIALYVMVLSMVMALLLGCSSQTPSAGNESTPNGSTSTGSTSTGSASTGVSTEKATIAITDWNSPQKEIWEEAMAIFKKTHSNVEFTYDIIPFDQYWTKLESAAASKTGADIVCMNPINVERFARNGALLPLTKYIERDNFDLSVFAETYSQFWKIDGENYAIPKDIDGFAVLYNKKIFDDAGVEYPKKGWTWDDFREKALILTNKNKGIYGWVNDYLDFKGGMYHTILGFGGYILSDDKKTCGYDDPNTIAAIRYIYETVNAKEGVSPTLQQLAEINAADIFMSGRGAMETQGSFRLADYLANENINNDIAIAPMPVGSSEKMLTNGVSWAISNSTKNPDMAWEMLSLMCGDIGSELMGKSGVIIPANGNYQDLYFKSKDNVDLSAFFDRPNNTVFQPITIKLKDWRAIETSYITKIFMNEMSVEEACIAMSKEINAVLSK